MIYNNDNWKQNKSSSQQSSTSSGSKKRKNGITASSFWASLPSQRRRNRKSRSMNLLDNNPSSIEASSTHKLIKKNNIQSSTTATALPSPPLLQSNVKHTETQDCDTESTTSLEENEDDLREEDYNPNDEIIIVPETVPPPSVPNIDSSTEDAEEEYPLTKTNNKNERAKDFSLPKVKSITDKESSRNSHDDETNDLVDNENNDSHRKREESVGLEPQLLNSYYRVKISVPHPSVTGNIVNKEFTNRGDNQNNLDKDTGLEQSLIQDLIPIIRPYLRTSTTDDYQTFQEQISKYKEEIQILKSKCLEWEQKYHQLYVKTQQSNHQVPMNDNELTSRIVKENTTTVQNDKNDICNSNILVPDNVPSSTDIPRTNHSVMIPDNVPSSTNVTKQRLSDTIMKQTSSSPWNHQPLPLRKQNPGPTNHQSTKEDVAPTNDGKPPEEIVTTISSSVRIKQEPNRIDRISRISEKIDTVRPKQESKGSSGIIHPNEMKTVASHKRKSRLSTRSRTNLEKTIRNPYRYCEVIRNKKERQTELKGYTCPDCQAFFDAAGMDAKELHVSSCSKHRYRFTPPSTPDDFWELSFVDERDGNSARTSWP